MKLNTSIYVLFIFLFVTAFLFIPATHCYSSTGKPIPIKQIFDPPPKPYIDDGEPGDSPWGWQCNNFNFIKNNKNNDIAKDDNNNIIRRAKLLFIYYIKFVNLKI